MRRALFLAATLALGPASAFAVTMPGTTAVDGLTRHEGDRMTAALNLLEAKGDASFTNFAASGNGFSAIVSQNGRSFRVSIDPDRGQVTPLG